MATCFKTIQDAKAYARERLRLDEETYHVAWNDGHEEYDRALSKWVKNPIFVFSDPELKYGLTEWNGLDKTVFATFSQDAEGKVTITLDQEQWELVAKMLEVKDDFTEGDDLDETEHGVLDTIQKKLGI